MASAEAAMTMGEQVRRFWRWWIGELRACIPAGITRALHRAHVLPLVVAEPDGFALHRFDGSAWQRLASAHGETPEAAAAALGTELRKAHVKRFALGLKPGQYLSKVVYLPQAAEDNLRDALRYELDRHTPFKPEDVGFDCCVASRDSLARQIAARMVIAPKTTIAHALETVAGSGVAVAAVQPAFADAGSMTINLLPHEDNGTAPLQRLLRWAPWVLIAGLGLAALVLPVYQKRAQVIELQPQVNVAAQQAQAADSLHQQLERAQNEYNFLLQKRYAAPTSLQLLNEVTKILPDDTWLQNFELRTTSKGKELQLQGETGVAGKMIELFEQSALVSGASFKSPVTQAPGSQGSRFHIGMDVKEVAPPSPQVAASSAATPSEAPAATAPVAGSAAPAPAAGAGVPSPVSTAGAASSTTSGSGATSASASVAPSSSSSAAASAAPAIATATTSSSSSPSAPTPKAGGPAASTGTGTVSTVSKK